MSPPERIGRLHVERRLGAGGFATVWLAHDPGLDDAVAVKVLADNWTEQAEIRRRFVDEARLLRRVDSDHLVRVYDIGELPDGRPYFVMTYADRGCLSERLTQHPPPWSVADVLDVVDAVTAGLTVLHGHGIVHRDVKPSNLLLRDRTGGRERVMLGDLGIAKDLRWASGITMPAGSSRYMAPEQRAFSDRIGPPSDVHALAVTAGQLLGLAPPWPHSPLGQVLERATRPDPEHRTPSATAFAEQLRSALAPPPPARPVPPAGPVPPIGPSAGPVPSAGPSAGPVPSLGVVGALARLRRRVRTLRPRRRAVVAALAAVVLLLGSAGWWGYARGRTVTPKDGKVSVRVPWTWLHTSGAAFPGDSDSDAGISAGSGGRTIAVAYTWTFQDPATTVADAVPTGCTSSSSHDLTIWSWHGVLVRHTGCPDGTTVDEAVFGSEAEDWTVWVEVRSRDGDPNVSAVLASVRVTQ